MKKLMTLALALGVCTGLSAFAQDTMKSDPDMKSDKMADQKADKKADKAKAKADKAAAKVVTVAGIVTDPMCAKSGDKKKMMDSDCAKKCAADGKWAFVSDKDGQVWNIDNPDEVKGHEGHHVKLTGHADKSAMTFHVEKVAMLSQKTSGAKHKKKAEKKMDATSGR